jgi:general secretion pathway protein C
MQDFIKRYFWVIGAVTVVTCAVFAAKATGSILTATFLADSNKAPKVTPVQPRTDTVVKPTRSKDGGQLATRNMFCSECTPAAVVVNNDPSSIQQTSLPLVLLATNVSPDPEQSYASVINTESQKQGAYGVGEMLPGASGKVKTIGYKFVDFENNGHIERLGLSGAPVPTPVAATNPEPAPAEGSGSGDDLQASIDSGIKKIDDTTYEIDKGLVEKVLVNPMAVAKGARVVPAMKNGKPEGFKLYAIRPTSVYAKLGLTNGDTLTSINGFELTSADKALEVYTKLREATSLELEVTRRGKPVTLKYTIR